MISIKKKKKNENPSLKLSIESNLLIFFMEKIHPSKLCLTKFQQFFFYFFELKLHYAYQKNSQCFLLNFIIQLKRYLGIFWVGFDDHGHQIKLKEDAFPSYPIF